MIDFLKVKNKINIFPIALYLIWSGIVLNYFFFKSQSFESETPCGAGYMMIGLPIMSVVFALFFLIVIAIINLFSKKEFYTDFKFIVGLFIMLSLIGIISMVF